MATKTACAASEITDRGMTEQRERASRSFCLQEGTVEQAGAGQWT